MTPPPITNADIKDQWLADLREASLSSKAVVQAHPKLPRIQAWSQNTHSWHDVMLPGRGFDFTSTAERDSMMARYSKL